ncbi:MAG TPA: heat-inducible transcription repressor HrcA [Firmicutes bacterium]|nr:heat-inducible transcription repressor HrcA [Bacillota bacterium]
MLRQGALMVRQLDERKRLVLSAVVEDYIETCTPVGSRTLSKRYNLGISPATIRNEMADLEEMGLLEQPHTSAGRVPSDRGYRYYVDELMPKVTLDPQTLAEIQYRLYVKATQFDQLLQATARVLSEATDYMAVVLGPEVEDAVIERISYVKLTEDKALLVVVNDTCLIHEAIIDMPPGTTAQQLVMIGEIVTKALRGLAFSKVSARALQMLRSELNEHRDLLEASIEALHTLMETPGYERLALGGASNILKQPEFRDTEKLQLILKLIERRADLIRLAAAGEGEVVVRIGTENRDQRARELSLITAEYSSKRGIVGRIGVLGPRRMKYNKALAVVTYVQELINDWLEKSAL